MLLYIGDSFYLVFFTHALVHYGSNILWCSNIKSTTSCYCNYSLLYKYSFLSSLNIKRLMLEKLTATGNVPGKSPTGTNPSLDQPDLKCLSRSVCITVPRSVIGRNFSKGYLLFTYCANFPHWQCFFFVYSYIWVNSFADAYGTNFAPLPKSMCYLLLTPMLVVYCTYWGSC